MTKYVIKFEPVGDYYWDEGEDVWADQIHPEFTEVAVVVGNPEFQGVEDEWDKFNDYKEYDEFCTQWLKECKRVMKKNASIWVIGAFQNIYRLGYIMQNMGFWILNDVVWSKPNAVPNFGGTRFQNSHETLLWCTKNKNAKYTFNYKTMKHLNNEKQEKSVWNIGICIGNERLKGEDGKSAFEIWKEEIGGEEASLDEYLTYMKTTSWGSF